MTWFVVEVDDKGSRPHARLDEHLHHPKINLFYGFEWLDLDIVVRPMKLYKMSSKATLIPLVVESIEGGRK